MFVVRRPFRGVHGMIPAGSVVEPAGIRQFKKRVLEGHIVEVTEHNFDTYAEFFKQRYGVVLTPPTALGKPDKKPAGEVAETVNKAAETSVKAASVQAKPIVAQSKKVTVKAK